MAGDWMKVELSLPDKPEVHRIAGILNIDPDAVVGKLLRVWAWFDQHTENGNAHGVTYSLLDRVACVSGFAEAMFLAGWLEQKGMTLSIPKFDRHSSKSAKSRANTGIRVKKHREDVKQECNGESVTEALPEKRREEVKDIPTKTPSASSKKGSRLPDGWLLPKAWGEWALSERKDWNAEEVRRCAERFSDFWRAKPGRDACKLDWLATWRNWVRNDRGHSATSPTSRNSLFAGVL